MEGHLSNGVAFLFVANDIVRVNGLLRSLFDAVVVNVIDGTVKADWFGQHTFAK
jgi:hypothetical protein